MLRRLVPTILTLVACQQTPAKTFESGVDNLAHGTVAVAPSGRSVATAPETPAFERPTYNLVPRTPELKVSATVTLSPPGATLQSQLDFVTLGVDLFGATPGEVAIEVIAPSGSLYQRFATEIAGDATQTQHVEFVLPVAGTWIDSQAMTGTWYAHVFYRGSERLTQSFDLDP